MTPWIVAALLALTPEPNDAAPDQTLVRRAAEAVRTAYHCPEYRPAAALKESLRDRNIEIVSPANFPVWEQAADRIEELFDAASADEKPQLCETFWALYGEKGSAAQGWLELRAR